MQFHEFNTRLQAHFADKFAVAPKAFVVQVDADVLWNHYLDSFPPEMNQVFRKRREFDCTCCRTFVKRFGAVVVINSDYSLTTIWDFNAEHSGYQQMLDSMSSFVKSAFVNDAWISKDKEIGTQGNVEILSEGGHICWNHFHVNCSPLSYGGHETVDSVRGELRTTKNMLERSLLELSSTAIQDVIDMIAEGTVPRGDQWSTSLAELAAAQQEYLQLEESLRNNFLWLKSVTLGPVVSRIKNHSIGVLIESLTAGTSVIDAMNQYARVVDPVNYQRSKGKYSETMARRAVSEIARLGLEPSLARRFARLEDITVKDVIFASQSAQEHMGGLGGIMTGLLELVTVNPQTYANAEALGIEEFIAGPLRGANRLDVLIETRHKPNFVSLIAPQNADAPAMFSWSNNFSWAYTGNVTDSMRQAVAERGGNVSGALRFTHAWNHPDAGRNASLMDLHVFFPETIVDSDGQHDHYPRGRRIGWNQRRDPKSGASQDVDYVQAAPPGYIPVENISFPDIRTMPEGTYTFKIHNWSFRAPTVSGFKAEIEFGGQIFKYDHPKPLGHKEWITLAQVTLRNGEFTITHKHPSQSDSALPTEFWGIRTNKFHQVSVLCLSPNHWNGQTGHKHYIFGVPGVVNPEQPNGFFNEYLSQDLKKHRQVLEALGGMMKVKPDPHQLSGLGFSSTTRNSVLARVNNQRVYKIIF